MIKYILLATLVILLADVLVSLIVGQLNDYYNPNIRATYSGFDAAILGIFLIILIITLNNFQYSTKFITFVVILVPILSVLGVIFQFMLGFYLGGWACLIWLIISVALIYGKKI